MRIPASRTSVTSRHPLAVPGGAIALILAVLTAAPSADNWPEWRGGPRRDGRSAETGLPTKWAPPSEKAPAGENLAWRVPIGSRSTPVVFGNRVYLYAPSGDVAHRQERLVALDAATGKTLWERLFPVYLTDIPAHRVAWASPAVDPATGNIYTFGGNAHLRATSPDGKGLWERSLVEDFGAVTTHGGRAMSPVVDGDNVIVSTLISAWGTLGPRRQPLLRLRQEDGPDGVGQLAAGAPLGHQLLDADHHDRQRRAPRHRRRHRRRLPRPQGGDRRAGLEARRQQACHQQLDGDGRHRRDRDPQRRELRHQRDGPGHRASTPPSRARSRRTRRSGSCTVRRSASRRRSWTSRRA